MAGASPPRTVEPPLTAVHQRTTFRVEVEIDDREWANIAKAVDEMPLFKSLGATNYIFRRFSKRRALNDDRYTDLNLDAPAHLKGRFEDSICDIIHQCSIVHFYPTIVPHAKHI